MRVHQTGTVLLDGKPIRESCINVYCLQPKMNIREVRPRDPRSFKYVEETVPT